jgi:hypothetical protein
VAVGSREQTISSASLDLAQSGRGLTGPIVMRSHLKIDVEDLGCPFLPAMLQSLMSDIRILKTSLNYTYTEQLASTNVGTSFGSY